MLPLGLTQPEGTAPNSSLWELAVSDSPAPFPSRCGWGPYSVFLSSVEGKAGQAPILLGSILLVLAAPSPLGPEPPHHTTRTLLSGKASGHGPSLLR